MAPLLNSKKERKKDRHFFIFSSHSIVSESKCGPGFFLLISFIIGNIITLTVFIIHPLCQFDFSNVMICLVRPVLYDLPFVRTVLCDQSFIRPIRLIRPVLCNLLNPPVLCDCWSLSDLFYPTCLYPIWFMWPVLCDRVSGGCLILNGASTENPGGKLPSIRPLGFGVPATNLTDSARSNGRFYSFFFIIIFFSSSSFLSLAWLNFCNWRRSTEDDFCQCQYHFSFLISLSLSLSLSPIFLYFTSCPFGFSCQIQDEMRQFFFFIDLPRHPHRLPPPNNNDNHLDISLFLKTHGH